MTSSLSFKQFRLAGAFAIVAMLSSNHASAQTASLDAAVSAASQWATLADLNQSDRMWATSGAVMQKSISKEDWAKYVANLRNELGALDGREWVQVVRLPQPTNLPKAEYVNVVFSSRFDKAPTAEAVSLVQNGGRWVPVGYVVHKIQPAAATVPAPATPAPPAAK